MAISSDVWKRWEGRVVDGKFPLQKWIGGSEQGATFLTERNAKRAAIKLIIAGTSPLTKNEQEAQLSRWAETAKLSHPHVIQLFECGRGRLDDLRVLYVVMEYADENLGQILPQRSLSSAEVDQMLPPTVEALSFLHQSGFVHGDIKPANVMAVDDQLKISADSLRKPGERNKRAATAYDAPEGSATGDSPATDIWSLGAMLVAVFTQHEPDLKVGRSGQTVVPGSIPEPYQRIAKRALCLEPQQRGSLDDVLSDLNIKHAALPKPIDQPRPDKSPRWWLVPVIAAVLLLAVIVIRKWTAQPPPAPPVSESRPAEVAPVPTTAPAPMAPSSDPKKSTQTDQDRGKVLQQVMPDVSVGAQNTITGRVKVSIQVSVDTAGNVSQAKFVSAGPSKYFANQALSAARRWRFSPPKTGGVPSTSEWLLRFEFGRKSTQVFPAEVK